MGVRALILAAIMAVTGIICLKSPPLKSGNTSGVVMQLPSTLSGFISTVGKPDETELKILPADTEFEKRDYFTPTDYAERKDLAHVSIVLSGAERKSIHRPEKCLVAQGWKIIRSNVISIPIHGKPNIEVTDLTIEKKITLQDGQSQSLKAHYLYWFIGHDSTTPSHTGRTLISLADSMFKNMNHRWAYASVMSFVTDNLPVETSGQRIRTDAETVNLCSKVIQGVVPAVQKSYMDDPPDM